MIKARSQARYAKVVTSNLSHFEILTLHISVTLVNFLLSLVFILHIFFKFKNGLLSLFTLVTLTWLAPHWMRITQSIYGTNAKLFCQGGDIWCTMCSKGKSSQAKLCCRQFQKCWIEWQKVSAIKTSLLIHVDY